MEPDVSTKNTKLAFGGRSGFSSYPLIPMCSSRVSAFQGVGNRETVVVKGVRALSGCGYS